MSNPNIMEAGISGFKLSSLFWILVPAYISWVTWKWIEQRRAERNFTALHGCQSPPLWCAKWVLGLDMLFEVLRASKEGRILKFFCSVVERSGHTFIQDLLGVEGIGTIEPENIEAVLSTNFADYDLGLRPATFNALLGSGIFTQDGEAWKQSRQLLRPQFASNRTQNYTEIQQRVERLIAAVPPDGIADLQPLFFKLTFETTMFLLFGDHASNLGNTTDKEADFAEAFNLAQEYLAHRGRLGHLYFLYTDKKFRDACGTCHRFIDEAVGKALAASTEKQQRQQREAVNEDDGNYVFIDALVQRTRDPIVLRDQCLNILLAGRDTTGCCLTWTMRLLARHPAVLDRLREEIDSMVGLGPHSQAPTRETIKKMPYLAVVLKEVLRLYPSVPVNSRAAIKMTVLPTGGGPDKKAPILVKNGQAVGYPVYVMHRRKDIYGEDADEFRPERWMGDELKGIHAYAYLPFNGGPRICLGQEFALLEASYTIARLVQLFPNFTIPGSEPRTTVGDERQTLTLVVSSMDGCNISLLGK